MFIVHIPKDTEQLETDQYDIEESSAVFMCQAVEGDFVRNI